MTLGDLISVLSTTAIEQEQHNTSSEVYGYQLASMTLQKMFEEQRAKLLNRGNVYFESL